MSRATHFARALVTGYATTVFNMLFSICSVPLALHYLPVSEFGLWALIGQVISYLALVDFGMTGAIYRFLISHKDSRDGPEYAAVLTTGFCVASLQGLVIALCGLGFGPVIARFMEITGENAQVFAHMIFWQSLVTGFSVAFRLLSIPLQSYQRFDVINCMQIIGGTIGFVVMWWCFRLGFGIYSLLVSSISTAIFQCIFGALASWRLGFLPRFGKWGRPTKSAFKGLIDFGSDIFLLTVGAQLVSASQVIIVTRTLGLEAAAVWAVCTKTFTLGQQLVNRLLDFATPGLTEMYVRQEHQKLRVRFREVLTLSMTAALFVGGLIAAGNASFVAIWAKAGFSWPLVDDVLVALLLVCVATTRCLTACVGFDMKIAFYRYVYFLEGITFVALSWCLAPFFGFTAILASAIAADLIWCGIFGVHRTAEFFSVSKAALLRWLKEPAQFALCFSVVIFAVWWSTHTLDTRLRFWVNCSVGAAIGIGLLFRTGLTHELRSEIVQRLRRRKSVAPAATGGDS